MWYLKCHQFFTIIFRYHTSELVKRRRRQLQAINSEIRCCWLQYCYSHASLESCRKCSKQVNFRILNVHHYPKMKLAWTVDKTNDLNLASRNDYLRPVPQIWSFYVDGKFKTRRKRNVRANCVGRASDKACSTCSVKCLRMQRYVCFSLVEKLGHDFLVNYQA